MIKTLGLASAGFAATLTIPVTDTTCYNQQANIQTLCTGIETTYASSSALANGRCSADATAALGSMNIKDVCAIFTEDCLTKYCCGGPTAPSCTYWGPASKNPTPECNSANWLIDYVYYGNSTNAANPPADVTLNRCYGNMPGQSIVPAPSGLVYCTYSTNYTDPRTGQNVNVVNATGYVGLDGVCYPMGTAYISGMPFINYGYLYPYDYYWYDNAIYGGYYDMYGMYYSGLYYPYYGMYGYNGIYNNNWMYDQFYITYNYNYFAVGYGYWGMLAGTRYSSVEDFKNQKTAEIETEYKQLASIRGDDVLELSFSPKLTLTKIQA